MEHIQKLQRVNSGLASREVRLYGDFGNHKYDDHGGKMDCSCLECKRYTNLIHQNKSIRIEINAQSQNIDLEVLRGKKILVTESPDVVQTYHSVAGDRFGITFAQISTIPNNTTQYIRKHNIHGGILHLSSFRDIASHSREIHKLYDQRFPMIVLFSDMNYLTEDEQRSSYGILSTMVKRGISCSKKTIGIFENALIDLAKEINKQS